MHFISYFKANKNLLFIIILAIVFFFLYSWLPYNSHDNFTSPDETANYFFTKLFTEESTFKYYEPINLEVDGLVHPRSITIMGDNLIPGSFIGIIIIYGLIAKVFTIAIIEYLTSFFAVISVVYFYLLLKSIFEERVAFISAILLFCLPPFWLYSSRGMFHNILFISLLIIGLYYLINALNYVGNKKSKISFLISGLFIGLSLLTRSSEIVWISFVILTIIICNWKKIKFTNLLYFISPLGIISIFILLLNNYLFGAPFSFSYSRETIDSIQGVTGSDVVLIKLQKLFLPFGINLTQIKYSFFNYLLLIFPWYSIFWLIGIVRLLKNAIFSKLEIIFPKINIYAKKFTKHEQLYFIIYLMVSFWLIIYYGSFVFNEYFDQSKPLLGSSYARYWLPIFIFGLPLCVGIIYHFSLFFRNQKLKKIIILTFIVTFIFLSFNIVLTDPLYGLIKTKNDIKIASQISTHINSKLTKNDIIITGFSDKIFFPNQKVVVNITGNKREVLQKVEKLKFNNNLYLYYNPLDKNTSELFTLFTDEGSLKLLNMNVDLPNGHILYLLQ